MKALQGANNINNMINLLMIAYEFPPLNSGGSHRPYKFAKWLSEFGINPIILTPKIEAHSGINIDSSFDNNLNFKVIRTEITPFKKFDKIYESYYFNIIDRSAAKWEHYLINAIDNLLKEQKIDAIYITAPPFSMASIGVRLKKRYNLPLMLDMRDAWSNWLVTPYVSYIHYKLTLRAERKSLKAADVIIVTSEQTIADFKKLHPFISTDKFQLITNAYDESVPKFEDTLKINAPTEDKILKIGYVGSFYYTPYQRSMMFNPFWKKKPQQIFQYTPRKEDWLYRSPFFFFRALAALKEKNQALSKKIKAVFAGSVPDWLPEMINNFKLADMVELKGRMSHKEALAFQAECDMLLITSSKVIGGNDYSIAGKTFEYICMKKPILAFVCEGAQKKLLEKTGLSIVLDPDKTDFAVENMEKFLNGNFHLSPNIDFIAALHIKNTTAQLADIIKKLVHV